MRLVQITNDDVCVYELTTKSIDVLAGGHDYHSKPAFSGKQSSYLLLRERAEADDLDDRSLRFARIGEGAVQLLIPVSTLAQAA